MGTISPQISAMEMFYESSVPYRSVSPSSSGGTGGVSPSATTNTSDKRRRQSLESRNSSSSTKSKFTSSTKMSENRPPSLAGHSRHSKSSHRKKLSGMANWPPEPPKGTFSTASRALQSGYTWQSPALSVSSSPTPFLPAAPPTDTNPFFISDPYGHNYQQPPPSSFVYDPPCSPEEWKETADRRRERRRLRKAYLSLSDQKMGKPQLPIDLFCSSTLKGAISLGLPPSDDGSEPRRIKKGSSRGSHSLADGESITKMALTKTIVVGSQEAENANEKKDDARGRPTDVSEKGWINLSKRKERKKVAYPDPYTLARKLEEVRLNDPPG